MSKKILIVEDEAPMRDALAKRLNKEEHVVTAAGNLEDGFKTFNEGDFDALVLDLMLPDGNGLELAEKIRATEKGANVRIIILTSQEETENIATAMQKGVYDFHIKSETSLEEIANLVS